MSYARRAGIERRVDPRVAVKTPARLFYGKDLAMWADGVIRDVSVSGAKIELDALFKLPPRLVMIDLPSGTAYEALLKWRRGDMAGLQFEATHDVSVTAPAHLSKVRETWVALTGGKVSG